MIHGHGDDFQGELVANFSSNVWYGTDNAELYGHLASVLPASMRYPEADAGSLNRLIAEKNGVEPTQVAACNGSAEAFYLIAHAFAGSVSLVVAPTFSEYADACRLHQHKLHFTSREKLNANILMHKPGLVWICNPNNPDGFCFPPVILRSLASAYPETVFVIDQAYKDFCLSEAILPEETNRFRNIILVQSLTKRYSMPGLRLGYWIANADLTAKINRFRIPWSVNTMAIEAGKYILQHDRSSLNLKELLQRKDLLQQRIDSLEAFETLPSQTPYFLVKLKKCTAEELKDFLLKDKILIRDATNFAGLEDEYIRIMTLTDDKNELLMTKLEEWNRTITR